MKYQPTPRLTLSAGLLAGTLDATGAILQQKLRGGVGPERLFQYIASAFLGKAAAYADGWASAALGLLMHYSIALTFTAFYIWVLARAAAIRDHPWTGGLLYGAGMWCVMTYIAIPFTRITLAKPRLATAAEAAGILVVAIGWPVALLARRAGQRA